MLLPLVAMLVTGAAVPAPMALHTPVAGLYCAMLLTATALIVKPEPPTYRMPAGDTAAQRSSVPVKPLLMLVQALPFHMAILLVFATPPMLVNVPTAMILPLGSTASWYTKPPAAPVPI